MPYKTIIVEDIPQGRSITLNRVENRNSINALLLEELHQELDQVEKNAAFKLIILKGQQGLFCTGMDFQEVVQNLSTIDTSSQFASSYQNLLKRFTTLPKIIISVVDGQVMAGGVGLVAASDLVIATSKSQFTLSEALWGLLPANVLPYLIRRIGFQKSYLMTLATQTMCASDALIFHLIDELSDEPEAILRKYILRFARLNEQTIRDIKNFFRKLWIVDEKMEQTAIQELTRLIKEPRIQNNIKQFVESGKFPWE